MSVNSSKNMDGSWITFVGTGAPQVLTHQLNRPIVGFLVFNKNAKDDVWTAAPPTTTQMTVQTANVGTTFLIFVI